MSRARKLLNETFLKPSEVIQWLLIENLIHASIDATYKFLNKMKVKNIDVNVKNIKDIAIIIEQHDAGVIANLEDALKEFKFDTEGEKCLELKTCS